MVLENRSANQLIARTSATKYDRLASIYDVLANLVSAGRIRAVKQAQLEDIRPGDRVFYAGVGGGEDAAMAARAGARVTVLDLSPKMLARAERRFRREGVHENIESITGNVLQYRPAAPFDVVCANFFLNVFSPADKREVLTHLRTLVRQGGKLLIADFAPAEGGFLLWLARNVYSAATMLSCHLIAGNALHGLYDYREDLAAARLQFERRTPCGAFFCTLTASPMAPDECGPGVAGSEARSSTG